MNPRRLAGLAIVLAAALRLGPPAAVQGQPARDMVLSDTSAIDPADNGSVRRHVDIVIRDGTISAIRAHRDTPDEGGARVDASGTCTLPGFIDMHVHALLSPRDSDGRILPRPAEATTRALLRLLLDYGVTTIRDPGDPTTPIVELRDAIAAGRIEGPRMFVAGRIMNSSAPGPEFVRVTSPEEVCAEVERQAAARVDFVKVYAGLPLPLVRAAIACAHRRHLPVIGHLQATTWTEAAAAGI